MACKGCGDKQSRYSVQGQVTGGDIDNPTDPLAPEVTNGPPDQMSSFYAARKMSYEELTMRRETQQRMIKASSDQMMSHMTDAMRRVHLDELISVVNCRLGAIPGMVPDQAVVALKEAIDRPDFEGVLSHYPGLKVAVNSRYEEVKSRFITIV